MKRKILTLRSPALLGYYAPCGGNSLHTFQDNLPVPEGLETSVRYCRYTVRRITEERGGSLKSQSEPC